MANVSPTGFRIIVDHNVTNEFVYILGVEGDTWANMAGDSIIIGHHYSVAAPLLYQLAFKDEFVEIVYVL